MTSLPPVRGRGATVNPKHRFESIERVPEPPQDSDDTSSPQTQFFADSSKSIVAYNDSPDVGFDASVNPYRGCEHGCVYCYARPSHEYLGFSAGLDFETKIMVKEDAAELLRQELSSRAWKPQLVALSGNTDCYQPVEKQKRLTRRCLEVLLEFRNPVVIITKNHLVTRDIDILAELARYDCIGVTLSLTTLDHKLSSLLEPRASRPARRLAAIKALADGGVPVGYLQAPMIPGLTDSEAPAIALAAAKAGATFSGYVALRLPFAVKALFEQWLNQHYPDKKQKILNRVREIRGGKLNDPNLRRACAARESMPSRWQSYFNWRARSQGLPKDGRNSRRSTFGDLQKTS